MVEAVEAWNPGYRLMTLSTYAELQTEIGEFLNRDDLTAQIPTFIRLAESQIGRDVKHWRAEKRAQAVIDERYVDLPSDFRRPISLYIDGANSALRLITTTQMQDKRYSNADTAGTPCFYAITAGSIELFPTPSSGTLNLYYQANIEALSDSNTTNWLLDEAPDVYLYASLLQTAPYLQDDERLPVWSTLYTAAVTNLNKDSEEAKFGDQRLVAR